MQQPAPGGASEVNQKLLIVPLLQYKDRSYTNFLRGIHTPVTNHDYSEGLQKYINYLNEVKRLNIQDTDALLKGKTAEIEDRIMDFIAWQKERGLKYSTIRLRVSGVKHLYEMNRKPLSWKLITRTIGKRTSHKDRAYTHQEIAKMLQFTKSPRDDAIILSSASSGMREGALAPLNFSHLKPIESPYGKVYRFIVYQGDDEEYITFCTPEAAKAIDTYKTFREQYGEKVTPDSPLFRDEFNKRSKASIENAQRLAPATIRTVVDEIAVASGVKQRVKVLDRKRTGTIRHEVKIFHGFKKFAATNMVRAKVEPTYREYMLSHLKGRKDMKVDELEMIYDRPEESDLFNEYSKAIDALTINEEFRQRKKIAELQVKADNWDNVAPDFYDAIDFINKLKVERGITPSS